MCPKARCIYEQGPDLNVPAADYSEGGLFFGFEEKCNKVEDSYYFYQNCHNSENFPIVTMSKCDIVTKVHFTIQI